MFVFLLTGWFRPTKLTLPIEHGLPVPSHTLAYCCFDFNDCIQLFGRPNRHGPSLERFHKRPARRGSRHLRTGTRSACAPRCLARRHWSSRMLYVWRDQMRRRNSREGPRKPRRRRRWNGCSTRVVWHHNNGCHEKWVDFRHRRHRGVQ